MKRIAGVLSLLVFAFACLPEPTAQAQLVVTTTADEDDGSALPGNGAGTSLREAVKYASPGVTITFAPALSGQTIAVTHGLIGITKSVTIDASALADAVIINGHGLNSLFHCGSQTTNTFIGLTLTGGRSTFGGGAILNDSVLTLNDCTLTGNTANEGGAIFQFTPVTLNRCTVVGNSARYGGGIENDGGTLTLNNSTVTGNVATQDGGGILNFFDLILNNSTVVGNHAFAGGGISEDGISVLFVHNSIVAGNTATSPTTEQIAGGIDSSSGINITSGNPMLAPLSHCGGRTPTMPPLPGSPAIDPAGGHTSSVFATDQRGLARVVGARADVGAAEFQGASDVARFWPTDWDGDGRPFGVELALGLNPVVPDAGAAGTPVSWPPATGNGIEFGFNPAATNYTAWVVKRWLDLSVPNSSVEIFRFDGPTGITTTDGPVSVNFTGSTFQLTDNTTPRPPQAFYQLLIAPSP